MQRRKVLLTLVFTLLLANIRPCAVQAASIYSTSGSSILKNGTDFVIHGININGPGVPGKRKVAGDVGPIADIWKFNFVRVSCSIAPTPSQEQDASTLDEIVKAFTARDIVVEISLARPCWRHLRRPGQTRQKPLACGSDRMAKNCCRALQRQSKRLVRGDGRSGKSRC